MAKYENIRALAKKQLQAVTESSDRWKAFLRTAAIAYNYSFPNQLLIHEQSPTATAVADIAYWNNNAGRWVKRGAHGIAVFDTRANSSRLRYLFDISDTIPRAEIPEALPWVITDQNWRPVWDKIVADNHADSIQSALLMLSTSCVAQRSAMFTTALGKAIDGSSLQWAKPDEQRQLFLQLITQSCLYMAALRCGVDTARLDLSALESVNQFDTHIKRYIDQGIPPICHCLPVSLNQHWVVPFKYTNGSGWDSNRDRFSNQCHRTDTNWQVNATKRACLSGRGYCPNAVHQPAGSLYTVQHNNGFPCAAYRYFDPSQQGQL